MSSMTGVQSVGHLSGEHATDLLGVDRYAPLIKVFGLDKAREIVQWDRTYGTHYVLGVEWNGQLDEMCLNEMPAIATYLIRDDPRLKSPLPTRQEVLDFTAAQDWRRDPEDEITSAIKKSFDTETKDIPMLRREFGDDPRVDKAEAALADRLVLEQQKKALNRRHKPDPGLLDFSGRELFRFGFTKLEIHAMPKRTDADAAAAARHRAVLEAVEQKRARDAGNAIVAQRDAANIELPPVTSLTELLAESDDPVRFRIEGLWPADGAKVLFPAQAGAGKTTMNVNLIRSLADGDPFLGVFGVHQTFKRIVLIDNEMTRGMLRRWLRRQGIRHLDAVVDVVNLRGRAGLFDMGNDRIRDRWTRRLGDLGTDLVLFDCLKPVLSAMGLDENREADKFLYPLTDMLAAAGVRDMLVDHHMGHHNERARGDSSMLGWSDATWKLVFGDTDATKHLRYFATDKVRDAEELVPEGELTLEQDTRRLTYAAVSRKESAANTAVETKAREIAEVLAEALASDPDDAWMNKGDVYKVVKGNKGVFDAALELGVTGTPPLLDREFKGVAKRYRLRAEANDPFVVEARHTGAVTLDAAGSSVSEPKS